MSYGEHCFYVPGKMNIIDTAQVRQGDTVMRGDYSGKTLEETRVRYPRAQLGKLDEVTEAHANAMKSPPARITKERFHEMLNVLPPAGWVRRADSESFKMIEHTSGTITAIFARIGDEYWEMQDSFLMPHDAIMAAIIKAKGTQ